MFWFCAYTYYIHHSTNIIHVSVGEVLCGCARPEFTPRKEQPLCSEKPTAQPLSQLMDIWGPFLDVKQPKREPDRYTLTHSVSRLK